MQKYTLYSNYWTLFIASAPTNMNLKSLMPLNALNILNIL